MRKKRETGGTELVVALSLKRKEKEESTRISHTPVCLAKIRKSLSSTSSGRRFSCENNPNIIKFYNVFIFTSLIRILLVQNRKVGWISLDHLGWIFFGLGHVLLHFGEIISKLIQKLD
jgi:hypothetical protein